MADLREIKNLCDLAGRLTGRTRKEIKEQYNMTNNRPIHKRKNE